MINAFDLVKNSARRLGIAVSRYPSPGSFERHLRDYLSQMEINVVLDVGAFVGNYAREMRELGYRGKIISFEPVPASYEQLQSTMRPDSLWCGQPFGLSDENREALINTHSQGNFNSLLTIREDAELAYSLDPALRGRSSIHLKRLDAVLPQLVEGIPSPRIFVKLDTQGHDISVFTGAVGVLDMIVGFQSELSVVPLYEGMLSMPAALNYYAGHGFVPMGFYPVHTFRETQVSPEFDVLFTRFDGKLYHPGARAHDRARG